MRSSIGKIFLKITKLSYKLEKNIFKKIFFLTLFSTILSILSVQLSRILLNLIQKENFSNLLMVVGGMLIINICSEIAVNGLMTLQEKYRMMLDYLISLKILEKNNKQDLFLFEDSDFYDSMQRAEIAGGNFPFQIMVGIINIFSKFITYLVYSIILFNWNHWSILITIIYPIFFWKISFEQSKFEYKIIFDRTKNERKSWYFAHLLNKGEYIKETRIWGAEGYLLNRFKEYREQFIIENITLNNLKMKKQLFFQIILILVTIFLIYLAIRETIDGKMLIGTLMLIITSITNAKNATRDLTSYLNSLYQNLIHSGNLVEFLDFDISKESFKNFPQISDVEKIELRNVSFSYKGNSKALKNINITLSKDENYLVVGKNGSGKSTLIKLISGFYQNFEGEIVVNGKYSLKKYDLKNYRKLFSVVFQDYVNYQMKFFESITISNANNVIEEEKFINSLSRAGLSDIIDLLPEKRNQQLGIQFENGISLSGGQWQKLAIARAFYKSDPSVVIFDEPNSSLDRIADSQLFAELSNFFQDKISILVSHRFDFDFYGKIIVMDSGKIVGFGTHHELIEDNIIYKDIYNARKDIQNEKS